MTRLDPDESEIVPTMRCALKAEIQYINLYTRQRFVTWINLPVTWIALHLRLVWLLASAP